MPRKKANAIVRRQAPSLGPDLVEKAQLFKDVFGYVVDKVGEATRMDAQNRNRSLERQLKFLQGQHKDTHLSVQCHTRGLKQQLETLRGQYKALQTQSHILLGTCAILFIRIGLGW